MIQIDNGILLSHKKGKNNMDLEIVILSEVSQREKDTYDTTNMWNP